MPVDVQQTQAPCECCDNHPLGCRDTASPDECIVSECQCRAVEGRMFCEDCLAWTAGEYRKAAQK